MKPLISPWTRGRTWRLFSGVLNLKQCVTHLVRRATELSYPIVWMTQTQRERERREEDEKKPGTKKLAKYGVTATKHQL